MPLTVWPSGGSPAFKTPGFRGDHVGDNLAGLQGHFATAIDKLLPDSGITGESDFGQCS